MLQILLFVSETMNNNNNNNIYINDDKESISDFFKDSKILVTGATGFLGKVLVEKLLRCCEDIENIYILLRPKRGLETEQRLTELLKNPVRFNYMCFNCIVTN